MMKQSRHRRRLSAVFVLLALTAMVSAVTAQETTTGTITGQVIDGQGLPIPGASVTVVGQQGSKTVVTDAEGNFFAPFLVPGAYNVRVELEGFRRRG